MVLDMPHILEGIVADGGDAVGDGDGGETAAVCEGKAADRVDAVRDVDGGQAEAAGEGRAADGGDAVRNNGVLTTSDESVGGCLNDCITIPSTIIYRVGTINGNGG